MKRYIYLIASIINAVITAIYVAVSPVETVPSHFNAMGVADAYSSKWFVMFMPCIIIAVGIIYIIYDIIAENHYAEKNNRKVVNRVVMSLFLLFTVLFWYLTIVCISGVNMMNVNMLVNLIIAFLGGFIAVVSDVFPKLRQNHNIGIRVPATLSDEKVWNKTHKLAGYSGVIGGLVVMVMGIAGLVFGLDEFVMLIVAVAVIVISAGIIPTVYSMYVAKQIKN